MQKKTYFLVHPGINPSLYDTTKVEVTYAEILSHLESAGNIVILSNRPGVFQGIEMTVIPDLADLWVRDFGVIEAPHGVFAPAYAPTYHRRRETYLRGGVEEFRRKFWPEARKLDLVMETGNFVSNGKVAILCDKVISDNKLTKDELRRKLEPLELDEVVLLPREPYDWIGHADGMVCLLGEDKLLCTLGYKLMSPRYERAVEKAQTELERHFEVLNIPSARYFTKETSAIGCYANLLVLPDKILMPTYDLAEDIIVLETIQDFAGKPVHPISARSLAEYDGVLHCATFETSSLTTKEMP